MVAFNAENDEFGARVRSQPNTGGMVAQGGGCGREGNMAPRRETRKFEFGQAVWRAFGV